MSCEVFDDACEGCLPALMDATTGAVLPKDHPLMSAVLSVWRSSTLAERKAFHAVTVLNSRTPHDVATSLGLTRRIQTAAQVVESSDDGDGD